jgi:hypothetical protein
MVGRRSIEVVRDNNIKRFASYISINEEGTKKLNKAFKQGDNDLVRDILSQYSTENFLENLMHIYDPTVDEIARKVLGANENFIESHARVSREKLEPKIKPIKREPKNNKKVFLIQKQKGKGTIYKRSKPIKWNATEERYLQNNSQLSNADLIKGFNIYFRDRSASSIITKKSRLKRK